MRVAAVMVVVGMTVACSGNSAENAAAAGAGSTALAAGAPAAPAAPVAANEAAAPAAAAAKPEPEIREVTVPAGTTLRIDLKSAVGSDTSRPEDAVRGELRQAVTVGGRTVLPVGTELVGTVTDVGRAGRVKGRARIAFRFESVRVAGERYSIRTAAIARQAAATKGEDATKIAIGAGAGAALGAILGGGDGAAKGAAIGGAGGTGAVLATRGREVRLGSGADVTTRLTAPVTVRLK